MKKLGSASTGVAGSIYLRRIDRKFSGRRALHGCD